MDGDSEKIYTWIDQFQFSRQKKNISRDFSDAVLLAEILKYYFPKLVELHNYAPKNSYTQKLMNWNTLQRKVLRKIGIFLRSETLEQLARSEMGVIENVLSQIKISVDLKKAKDEKMKRGEEVYTVEGLSDNLEGSIVPIKIKSGSKITDQKIVPAYIFDDMTKELQEREDIISALKSKITHLEKLLNIKDTRINDLKDQMKNVDVQNTETSKISSRFLHNIFS